MIVRRQKRRAGMARTSAEQPRIRPWVATAFLVAWNAPVLLTCVYGEVAVLRRYGGMCLATVLLLVALARSTALQRVVYRSEARPAAGAIRLSYLLGIASGTVLIAVSFLVP